MRHAVMFFFRSVSHWRHNCGTRGCLLLRQDGEMGGRRERKWELLFRPLCLSLLRSRRQWERRDVSSPFSLSFVAVSSRFASHTSVCITGLWWSHRFFHVYLQCKVTLWERRESCGDIHSFLVVVEWEYFISPWPQGCVNCSINCIALCFNSCV